MQECRCEGVLNVPTRKWNIRMMNGRELLVEALKTTIYKFPDGYDVISFVQCITF
jgi:hypothetical protein